MKKLLIIFFIYSISLAQSIIYEAQFETTFDGWRKGQYQLTSISRDTTKYGAIHPRTGSYMLGGTHSFGDGTITCATPLNMEAGKTYTFTLRYLRVSTSSVDTMLIAVDSLYTNRAVKLAGTTPVTIAASPQGMNDSYWRTITFIQTPSTNGGYMAIAGGTFTEFYLDSLVVRGPANKTNYFRGIYPKAKLTR